MSLFPDEQPLPRGAEAASEGGRAGGLYAAVAIEQSIDRSLDYVVPASLAERLRVGQRVKVPLGRGNKPVHGFVIELRGHSDYPKLKAVQSIEDPRVLVTAPLLKLALWMAKYYVTTLGAVLDCMVPGAVKKQTGLGESRIVRLAGSVEATQVALEGTKLKRRRAVLGRMLQADAAEGIEINRLAGEADVTTALIRKMAGVGLLRIDHELDVDGFGMGSGGGEGPEIAIPELNDDQRAAMESLTPRLRGGGFSVNLLYGVTGSGKTEVYLRAIDEVVKQGRQAIVMVPEIALTPQTVRRFTARFSRVAVLHSALSATARHRYWQQLAAGEADVVVGARSAVFAPTPRLGVIVVDEEHEPSYKQDQAPRYHGRDLAIMRAHLEGVPIVLGSATPSLEMWWRVQNPASAGAYHLMTLPRRVRNLAMPAIELVDMRQELRQRKGIHLLSLRLEALLNATVRRKEQAILLLNRRGYSNFVFCASCQEPVKCRFCDVTMTYHRSAEAHPAHAGTDAALHTGQLHCHYCLAVNSLPAQCPSCGKKLSLFGLGTQRVEEEIGRKFPGLRFARVDSDTMRSGGDYERLLGRFAAGEIDVMLGTQMIAKGLDYPNVTLVGVISADTALSIPDFRASERTFQLITQVAGRAGRGDKPGLVVVQTFQPTEATIRSALRQDFPAFAAGELATRREVGLPPWSRMARIVLRDREEPPLHKRAEALAAELQTRLAPLGDAVRLRGPMPCAINRIAGYWRQQIVVYSAQSSLLQEVLAGMRAERGLVSSERIAIDVDPVSLL